VQVTGTASNNKLFTVEVITDSGNVIVNQAHAGGTTSKSLVDETVSATVTLVAKWFNAPIGLGQGWLEVDSVRTTGVTYTNATGRGLNMYLCFDNRSSRSALVSTDPEGAITFLGASSSGANNLSTSPVIPSGCTYKANKNTFNWAELR
jgi:hypothetical protein